MEPRRPRRVFLTAAPADKAFAMRLAADLQERSVNAWLAERRGDLESARIHIRDADVIVQIISPATQSSRIVREHLRIAQLYQRSFISIVVEGDLLPVVEQAAHPVIDAREGRYQKALADMLVALSQETAAEEDILEQEPVHVEALAEPRNPYKGLRAFTVADSGDFFGRDRLIGELIERLRGDDSPSAQEAKESHFNARYGGRKPPSLLAVVGASGSGKSSVVMAGVLPRLQLGALPGSEHWVYLTPITPQARLLEALANTLANHLPGRSFKSLREDLEDDSARGLHLLTLQLVKEAQNTATGQVSDAPPRVVLFIDQFEELFILTCDEQERQQFIQLLITAITEPNGPLMVILTLRADFYDRLGTNSQLGELIDQHQAFVWPMGLQDLRNVIREPAALPDVQLSFEGDLMGYLLFEMQGQPGALPLLQFTLEQLFERRDDHSLTLSAYQEIGGVKGALAKQAKQAYATLPSDEHRKLACALFVRLIDPGAIEQDTTRRRAALSEFTLPDPTQTRLMRETIDTFIATRLLTTNEIAGTTTIEVSHEALIREWPRLAGWLREAHDDIPIQQAISENVAEWERRGKPRDRLYRGSQLKEARVWATRNLPSSNEVAFLRASTARRRFSIARVMVAVLLLLTAAVLIVWSRIPPDPTRVTNLQDGGTGSLRWTIDNAPSGNTITFDTSLHRTILLTSGDLIIGRNLTIRGPGAGMLSISSGKSGYIVRVVQGVTVTISGLTFKDSKTSNYGFIDNEGTLTLSNSIISGNMATGSGGGIFNNGGTITLTDSTVSGNTAFQSGGGGIFNNGGTITLTSSTISGNTAHGGIFNNFGTSNNGGTVTLTSSTISGNTAHDGGGIYTRDRLIITNSTIAYNKASTGGGITIAGGVSSPSPFLAKAMLTFCTLYGNAASSGADIGIFDVDSKGNPAPHQISSVTLRNSIVLGPSGPDMQGMFISLGYNLFLVNSGARVTITKEQAPDQMVQDVSQVFAALIQLRKNGGSVQTLALVPDPSSNPAVDKIPLDACQIEDGMRHKITADQRGMPRPDDGEQTCDIGAYESS